MTESEFTLQILLEFSHFVLAQGCVGGDTLTVFPGREVGFDAQVAGRDKEGVGRWAELLDEVGGVRCDVIVEDKHIEGKQ